MQTAYMDVIALVERLHRQFLEVIKLELDTNGVHDINNVQAMILYNIGDLEMTVGELTLRGCYLGSNVSYNVKKMLENGYIAQERSPHDRRSVRVRLTEKGLALHAEDQPDARPPHPCARPGRGLGRGSGQRAQDAAPDRALLDPGGRTRLAQPRLHLGRVSFPNLWQDNGRSLAGPAVLLSWQAALQPLGCRRMVSSTTDTSPPLCWMRAAK